MEKLKILFGFADDSFEGAVKALLKQKGYESEIFARFNKESVKQFIDKNPDTAAVVLLEAFPRQSRGAKPQKYTAEEVAQLTEGCDVNVILVLSENYKGTDYMRTLFAAGITSAFLQKPKEGARPRDIAALILQKRNRKMAREYYGIGSGKIEVGYIESDDFNKLYNRMHSQENLLAGYLAVCASMTPTQIADFTKRLPEDDRDYLCGFEEFHTVMELLKKFGVDLKIKKPRKVVIGLKKNIAISMKDGHMVFGEGEKKEEEKKAPSEPVEEEPKEEKPVEMVAEASFPEETEEKAEIKEEVKEEPVKEPASADEMLDMDLDMNDLLSLALGKSTPQKSVVVEKTVVESVKVEEPAAVVKEPEPKVTEEPIVNEPIVEEVKIEEKVIEKPVDVVAEEPKKEIKIEKKVLAREEEEEYQAPITFEDDEYDDVVLGEIRKKKSPAYVFIMLLFLAAIAVLYYYTK